MDDFVRNLTKKDCAKGFHDFRVDKQLGDFMFETCYTCGERERYDASNKDASLVSKWRVRHKLDLLQPYGNTLKDFVYYYGEVKGSREEPQEVAPKVIFKFGIPKDTKRTWQMVREVFVANGHPFAINSKKPLEMVFSCCNSAFLVKKWKEFPLIDKKCKCGSNYYVKWIDEEVPDSKTDSHKSKGAKESL